MVWVINHLILHLHFLLLNRLSLIHTNFNTHMYQMLNYQDYIYSPSFFF